MRGVAGVVGESEDTAPFHRLLPLTSVLKDIARAVRARSETAMRDRAGTCGAHLTRRSRCLLCRRAGSPDVQRVAAKPGRDHGRPGPIVLEGGAHGETAGWGSLGCRHPAGGGTLARRRP